MAKRARLSPAMNESEFEHGYWYATELRAFAKRLGIASAAKLRKDELERAIKALLRTGRPGAAPQRALEKTGVPDVERGLSLELPVVHYTSNRETKAFIQREAEKLVPGFERASGTRYLLNRWREEQLSRGHPITYGDLVRQAIALNQQKQGPLRLEHGRYMNFISDFMAAHEGASHAAAVKAWHEVKALDAPKTYAAWVAARRKRK